MAEAGVFLDQFSIDQFSCPICLNLLKDPVTTPCGHSFCKECINECWDQEDHQRTYSCPQCRKTFSPRPDLCRNTILTEVIEKLKKTEVQAVPPAHCYAGPGDVECDFCTEIKRKATKSCLMCLTSFCETHLKPHYERPALKKHTLVEPCGDLQENICSLHDEVIKVYCRTDGSFICYLCTIDQHKGHDTATAKAERTKKEKELKEEQMRSQQRIQEKQKKVEELKQAVIHIKSRAQRAEQESEKTFTEMIISMEKRCSEIKKLIRDQEKAELSTTERLLQEVEQELTDLQRRFTEMETLSQTHDHIHFLQSFSSLKSFPGSSESEIITVNPKFSFDKVIKSLSSLKIRVEEFCKEEFNNISLHVAADQMISLSEPSSRKDFLLYFCKLTLDSNTVNNHLILSENNSLVRYSKRFQSYPDHSERFSSCYQVLCEESMCGRCYWEVEWSRDVEISVSYKEINRKEEHFESGFGFNPQSWSLCCASLLFYHNNIETDLKEPPCSRIGVYVDHSAGTLSFYSVSDTMKLLHRVQTTFTQPLYAGFNVFKGSVRLCNPE